MFAHWTSCPAPRVLRRTALRGLLLWLSATAISYCTPPGDDGNDEPWENTLTPLLINLLQRDTVLDTETVTFSTDNTSADRYIWFWGDGTKTDTTTTHTVTHLFKRLGQNQVKLRVERGRTYGEKTSSIWVKRQLVSPCGFNLIGEDSAYVQIPTFFSALINTPDCQSNCNFGYTWDFGDNSTGTGPHPTHAYSRVGTYLVKLRVSRCGEPDYQIQKTIAVTGNGAVTAYSCVCLNRLNGRFFTDTLYTQNLPFNPIKVDDQILRRSPSGDFYFGEFNCNPAGCENYRLRTFRQRDSIEYEVIIRPAVHYTCAGRRI